MPENAIVVARSMGPAALLDYDRKRLRGLVMEEGGPTSHVSIVARALGIPPSARSRTRLALSNPATPSSSTVPLGTFTCARHKTCRRHTESASQIARAAPGAIPRVRDRPCVTKDGQKVQLMINAGLAIDCRISKIPVRPASACSRTELQFMVADTLPRTGEQLSLYRSVLEAPGKKTGEFRTLDIGGDLGMPYLRNIEEENPALGWRAIRIGLDRPGLLRSQVRALCAQRVDVTLRLMFPMIAAVDEFD